MRWNVKKNVPPKAMFPFPTGSKESVHNLPFVVRAKAQVSGDEIEYDVTALFTVEYI
jgi:hypothetical protein